MSSPTPQEQHGGGERKLSAVLPDDLLARPQWVCWRYEERPGQEKPAKPPIDPMTGALARSDDPTTWGSFGETLARFQRDDDLDGIGFMFTDNDPLVGIDFDKIRDPETGEIAPEVRSLLLSLDSYTEISPSGTGLHVLVTVPGALPDHWCTRAGLDHPGPLDDAPGIEVYESGQYFSVTGNVLDGYGAISEGGEALTAIGEEYLVDDTGYVSDGTNAHTPFETDSGAESTTDPDAVNTDVEPTPYRIRRTLEAYATDGSEYAQRALDLWRSQPSDPMGHPSPSEADIEFAWRLAFWCRNDHRLVEQCIRKSDRYRDKWERDSYGRVTIETAVGNNHHIFRGRYVRG